MRNITKKVIDGSVDVVQGRRPDLTGFVFDDGLAVVTFSLGCGSFHFYPTPEALDTLAAQFSELAYAARCARTTAVVA